ncbi:MAG: hypothetical protein HYY17_14735 [Planctomycetes bacterium]|nr:hypothetical protein [Planctomycetota bacterium]
MSDEPATSASGCLLRFLWMMGGPAVLLIVGLVLVVHQPRIGGALDLVFAGAAILAIGARLLDRRAVGSRPGPYVAGILAIVVALFLAAHFVAPRLS